MNIPIHKIILVPLVLLAAGCSVVFTGSITGELHDKTAYDADEAGSGIADASIYLYTEEEPWTEDLAAWTGGTGPLPDYPEDTDGTVLNPRYFLKTVSDTDGSYTFNGFIWEDLFPQYGKSGDRKEIFLLYYQEDYGLQANDTPVYIVSDVTNRLPPTRLERIYNRATIQGDVIDSDTGEALDNVNVRVYVPVDWTYDDTTGDITVSEWSSDPDYLLNTDETGRYEREISFPMKPDTETNEGTCFVRLTFTRNGYIAENAADGDLTDGGWDADGDGTVEEEEDDAYYQSPVIEADTSVEMAEIAMAPEFNTATVTGTVEDAASGEGVGNVNVDIYVPESWDYNESTGAFESAVWPEEPTYSMVTNAAGDYTTEIEFAREPELTDNRGTVQVRIVFNRNEYETSNAIDGDITDGGWDADDDGTDDPYYQTGWITDGRSETLNTVDMRRTEYTATVEGRVFANDGTTPLNDIAVTIYIDQTAPPSEPWDDRVYSTPRVITESDVRDGYFTFDNVSWDMDATTVGSSGSQGTVTCCLKITGKTDAVEVTVYSNSDNYFEISQDP